MIRPSNDHYKYYHDVLQISEMHRILGGDDDHGRGVDRLDIHTGLDPDLLKLRV
jgi:hypothetical protein